jgi:hypothetical protein
VAHIVLLVMYIAEIGYLAHRYGATNLAFKPVNMDVLPLYILLTLAFPPVLWTCDCRT